MPALKNIGIIDDFNSFRKEIEKTRNEIDRTINLTWFYVKARFKINAEEFNAKHSVDGKNDGGIDCYFKEGNTYYIIQSKYHENSQRESEKAILDELYKIEKTLIGENPNKYAVEFVNALRRDLQNSKAYLEIIWLTTNEVPENTKKETQTVFSKIIGKNRWEINTDINFIDRYSLESVIYDIKHGYVPHTGKKELLLESGEYMSLSKDCNSIEAVVCNIKAIEILKWFNSSDDISIYLQKNVRESVGDKSPINKALRESFKTTPSLFWYKHNGIIVFVDWFDLNQHEHKITIRNPQIVNGGQTITQLFKAYDENRAINNPTKLLVRIYRLPYEDAETYKRSIDIITALNSQNKIKASDLHSTDPCQVMLENRFDELGLSFRYFRKRSEKEKKVSSWHNILMVKLAMYYHVCEYNKPDEGVTGNVELYFEEEKRYHESFPEKMIRRPIISLDHIVFKYIDCWYLYFFANRFLHDELSKKQQELFSYVMWFVLVDAYQQQKLWKERYFEEGWREWTSFIDTSEYGNAIIKYMKLRYPKYLSLIPKNEQEPRNYLKSLDARKKFLKNSGNQVAFKKELNKGIELYKKRRAY
jgi:hypothetical protein